MAFLTERDRAHLRTMLADMRDPVRLYLFVDGDGRESRMAQDLITEVSRLAPDYIQVEVFDAAAHSVVAALYGVTATPALVFLDAQGDDTGMRMMGLATGYEFAVLIEGMLDVSRHRGRLSDATVQFVRNLERDVFIDVFVTPT